MRVLSLFNGMGCIWLALDKLGIKVTKRYSSEIDKHAIKVNDANYPDTIQLGDVTQINGEELGEIDLLVGGSPCQGFSLAGKELNFKDPRSKLFFEFVRLLDETLPKYFLLENVGMRKEYEDVITRILGVPAIQLNSNLLSAQSRPRVYWTNLPYSVPEDKGFTVKDIMQDEVESSRYVTGAEFIPIDNHVSKVGLICLGGAMYPKSTLWKKGQKTLTQASFRTGNRVYDPKGKGPTLTASAGNIAGVGGMFKTPKGIRRLSQTECERMQTVPDGYTSCVARTVAQKMLGNGWTVDVIVHLLKDLKC